MSARFCLLAMLASVLILGLSPVLTNAQFPVPTAKGHPWNVSFGYSYLDLAVTPKNKVALSGVDISFTVDVSSRLGVTADAGYVRGSNVLSSGSHADLLSYLGGPVFYPSRGRLTTYLHALLGCARETGEVPFIGGFYGGWANEFSWVLGGGVDYKIAPSLGFRTGADYLHNAYFASSGAIKGQGSLRATGSLVYYFGLSRRH